MSSKKFIQNSFLHIFFFVLTQKRNKKSQDGSKRNFPIIGNILGRTVARRSRCCTVLYEKFLMRDMPGITTALIFRFPDFHKDDAMVKSKNRRLQNFTLFGTQKLSDALAFQFLSSKCKKVKFSVHTANYKKTGKGSYIDLGPLLYPLSIKQSTIS